MKKKSIVLLFLFLIYFVLSSKNVYGQVVINEFSSAISNDDWVEIYNNSNEFIDLSNYIFNDGSTNTKNFSCVLTPHGFFVVGWSDKLNNSGDIILLKKESVIVDCVAYGDDDGKKCEGKNEIDLSKLVSGEYGARSVDGTGSWIKTTKATKDGPNDGTQKNPEAICLTPTSTPTPTLTLIPTPLPTVTNNPQFTLTPTLTASEPSPSPAIPTPSITPTPLPISYDNIYLSEAMVHPETGEHEWVEIYNDNDYAVSLQNWYLDDVENAGSALKLFSLEIPAKSFGSVDLTSSVFNNDGDQVRLLDFNKSLKDSFEYVNPIKGKTYGRNSLTTDEFCLQEPTKNSPNNPCVYPTNTPSPTSTNTPTPTKMPTSTTTSISSTPLVNAKTVYETAPQTEPSDDINIEDLLTERGAVLSAKTGNKIADRKMIAYVKGLTSSSFFVSLLNIFYIVHKIIRKLNSSETM